MANWTFHKNAEDTPKKWQHMIKQTLALFGFYFQCAGYYKLLADDESKMLKLSERAIRNAAQTKGNAIGVCFFHHFGRKALSFRVEVLFSCDSLDLYIPSGNGRMINGIPLSVKKAFNHVLGTTCVILDGNDFWFSLYSDNRRMMNEKNSPQLHTIFCESGLMNTGWEIPE